MIPRSLCALAACFILGCAQREPVVVVHGGRLVPDTVWVDAEFGDSTHFLLTGATDWRETALVWFDTQLLTKGDGYAEMAARLADAPRSETRERVLAELQRLSEASWAAASPTLDSLTERGAVLGCRRVWIVNGAACTLARTADPSILAEVPGVARVFRGMPDREFPAPDSVGPRVVRPGPITFDADLAKVPWNLDSLRVPEVWREGLTGLGVGVVVHDGGFDLASSAVRDRLWVNPEEIAGNGLDDDGNGYVDDVHGFQFDGGHAEIHRAAVLVSELVHGSAVAALAVGGATSDTGIQLGVAPRARWAAVMAVVNFHEALEWALLNDFDVYGMSFSYPRLGEVRSHFRRMIEHASLAGMFFVSGAGNFGDPDRPNFAPIPVQLRTPEDIPLAVLAVGGVDSTLTVPASSSRGPVEWSTLDYDDGAVAKPDLATVNADLTVPQLGGAAATSPFRGNSFAAPHLVGIIALLLEADPEVSPWTLRQILMETARDLGPPGEDPAFGAGMVDASAALSRLRLDRPN